MALDGIFLYHLKNEIKAFALDTRVDKIHQPTKEEIILTLRSRQGSRKLLLSCNADSARIHFTDFAPENPAKPPMFTMLLRKHLTGARLTSIEQDGLERVLRLRFDAADELGERVKLSLIIEIMGKYSNIIFTDQDDMIFDAVKRVDDTKSQVRRILPGEKYTAPPAQNKLNIFTDDPKEISRRISDSKKTRAKAVQDTLMGVSPIICREMEAGLSLTDFKKLAQTPVPTVIIDSMPRDFTFIPIRQYGTLASVKCYESFSQLLDSYYHERVRLARIKSRSADLFRLLNTLQERAVRKALNREKELQDCENKEQLKIYGDLIISNQYRLEKGALFYDLENYYNDNELLRIPANPMLTPVQNAQKYYKEYRKKQIAQSKLTDFIRQAKNEALYFETVLDALSRAETDREITEIRNELTQGGYLKKRGGKEKKEKALGPVKYRSSDGFMILVGRNNIMNDRLTLKTAKNYDMWFHTKDTAGSHVVVECAGKEISDTAVHEAALLAAYNSKAKNSSNVPVDYTFVKYVKKPTGAKPGRVIYTDFKTEFVTPASEEMERLIKVE